MFIAGLALLAASLPLGTWAQAPTAQLNHHSFALNCDDSGSGLCADTHAHKNYEGKYVGHDEPSLLFYSHTPGSGNSSVYLLTLPKDPASPPVQDNTASIWNFQLHPAFWFGMAMCDTQSFPEFDQNTCNPDTDDNIFDSANPHSKHFIGKHPGTAFMEMQFYPPGWVASPQLIDPTNYFAALNIDSLGQSGATGAFNNQACLNSVGGETVNFAVITHNGVPLFPPNPGGVNFGHNNPDLSNVLSMAPGDRILVILHDTHAGFAVFLTDLTNGQTGFMVASASNGFGQVLYQPNSASCNITPYDFHPMYSTASEHTRVPWTAHSYNIAFSDEIGHFEYCDSADANTLNCLVPGGNDKTLDSDDIICATPDNGFVPPGFQQVGGCIFSELDFDGVPYGFNWPGTAANHHNDEQMHAQPIRFTSPLFLDREGELRNYDRVAFETNVNDFEPGCDFIVTGNGCVVPPPGVPFYPFYTTRSDDNCTWQEGGAFIPGTENNFGGSASSEFGPPLFLLFQTGPSSAGFFVNDNRQTLNHNPCKSEVGNSFQNTMHQFIKQD
jgi:hypothetical protein